MPGEETTTTTTTTPATTTQEDPKRLEALVAEELKKLGYDSHAQDVIKKANAEAKNHREAKEIALQKQIDLEAELKKLQGAEKVRQDEANRVKSEADALAAKEADAKKSADEKIAELAKKFDDSLKSIDDKSKAEQAKYAEDLKARDAQILRQAVMAEAAKAEIIDDSLVTLLDLSGIPVEHGVPSSEKIAELIAEHKKNKPHLYKAPVDPNAKPTTPVTGKEPKRPTPESETSKIDWGKLKPEEFEAKERELRRSSNLLGR